MKKIIYILIILLVVVTGLYFYNIDEVKVRDGNISGLYVPNDFPDYYDESAKENLKIKFTNLISEIEKNPGDIEQYERLSLLYKMVGKYNDAVVILEHLAKIDPKNDLVYTNLGDLYGYYIKDNEKAEYNFRKSIEVNPGGVVLYTRFLDFIKSVLKDDKKFQEITDLSKKNISDTANQNSVEQLGDTPIQIN